MWYPARIIVAMFAWLDATWSGRDRRSDGTIGDQYHRPPSGHLPDPTSIPRNCVDAGDVDSDGIHVPTFLANLFLHPSFRYVIHRGRIWRAIDNWRARTYTGDNWHPGHVHGSIHKEEWARDHQWFGTPNWWTPWSGELLSLGRPNMDVQAVKQLQAYLNGHGAPLVVDGQYGERTDRELRAFQAWACAQTGTAASWADGIAGPKTWAWLTTLTRGW